MDNNYDDLMNTFTDLLIEIVIKILTPIFVFVFAYFIGWITKVIVGELLVEGLNLIFNTARFTKDTIPILFATFSTIGILFKTYYLREPSSSIPMEYMGFDDDDEENE